jgi:hypothetical protein
MIDWFSGLVGYDASKIRLDRIARVTPDGQVVWDKEAWAEAEGSFSSTVQLTRDLATPLMIQSGFMCAPIVLRLSGNPTKYLQGHNIFGPSVADLGPVVRAMVQRLPDQLLPPDAGINDLRAVHRSRVDIAVMVDLGSHSAVHDWLRLAETSTRSRHGRAMAAGSTVYWGQHSTRWALKAYCKYCELKDHPPKDDKVPFQFDELREVCEGYLRLELVLRRPELKDRGTLTEEILWEFYGKVVIGVQKDLMDIDKGVAQFDLPTNVKVVLINWLDGRDVTTILPRRTFYKYRRLILDVVGVDISLTRRDEIPQLERIGFDVDYLRSRVVRAPKDLQMSLFKP